MSSVARDSMTPADVTVGETAALSGGAAGDSIAVAAWTIVSRVAGVVKYVAVAAVLGPTFFGNTYQFTNSLPNLVYYGFLGGSLFSSLLIPVLVPHIDSDDRRAAARISGGFLGITLVALAATAPLLVTLGPLVLKVAALGAGPHTLDPAQEHVGRLLIVMFIPQVFCYGVIGTASAVMNAHRRFALAAAAPALESLGIIAVLAITWSLFDPGTHLADVPTGELLLLGLGTTGAVGIHAAVQWWGAKRIGVVLLPRAGWRDPEVLAVVRRALPSLAQAGLAALQTLTLLVLANRIPGGVVAFQVALNFYSLAIAIGATPVALSLLPRLARMHARHDMAQFRDTLMRGFTLGFFVTVPAAVGYLTLAPALAQTVSFGQMNSPTAVTMVAVSLAALSLAVVGQTAFLIATYAAYAKGDTRSPLKSMVLQALTCLSLTSVALLLRGPAVLVILGLAYSTSIIVAACHLTARLRKDLHQGSQRLAPSLTKVVLGAALMAGPVWLVAVTVPGWIHGELGWCIGVVVAAGVGCTVFVALQALWRTPELDWVVHGLRLRGRADRTSAGVTDG
jgi:putative peptidoglycan lipid II flippase